MQKDLVIGIDCSTTACKAIAWTRDGEVIAESRYSIPIDRPRTGWHEQSAESWWLALYNALKKIMSQIDTIRIAGLSIAVQRETFVPVDDNGKALRPGICWMDERCRSILPEIDSLIGSSNVHRITGKPLSGNLSLGKIAWIKKYEPEVFKRTAFFQDVHAYLVTQLTGQYKTSWGCADPMGLFDMTRCAWSVDILKPLGIKIDQMLETIPPGSYLGEVTPDAAKFTGLPTGLPVFAGIGDGQAGALGAGIDGAGQTCINLGTAAVSATGSKTYLVDPAFRTTFAGNPGYYLLETVLLGGTYTVSWFIEQMGLPLSKDRYDNLSFEDAWEAEASLLPPGANGLILVPYWNSVMSPYWDAAASGMVVGWKGIHGRAHLYRAILEGIAYELNLQVQGVEKCLSRISETSSQQSPYIILFGGGSKSIIWPQILADVFNRDISISPTVEATSLGAGILAATAAGWYHTIPEAVQNMAKPAVTTFYPDPTRHAVYSRLYEEVYLGLFPAIQPALDRLTVLSEE